jgi:hypothetical protein
VPHLDLAGEDDGVDATVDGQPDQLVERAEVVRQPPFVDAQLVEDGAALLDGVGEGGAPLAEVDEGDALAGERQTADGVDAGLRRPRRR